MSKTYSIITKSLAVVAATLLLTTGVMKVNSHTKELADRTTRSSKKRAHMPSAPVYTFPGGGRVLLPHYRLVALYGTPGDPALGALGQQSMPDSLARIIGLAKSYQPYSTQPILPTLEIIATVASASPTPTGDYSEEVSPALLLPWIRIAEAQGVYVVLDLQSGRASFLSQTKQYASLLSYPNVGLALDPEWSLGPTQVPLVQIGSASIDDINRTAVWLAGLTDQHKLPQKLFLLQQWRLSMLPDRTQLNTSLPQLAYIIQMDGQGTQQQKLETWKVVTQQAPPNVYFGWKNFYLEDTPLRSPKDTLELTPEPWYVSYE